MSTPGRRKALKALGARKRNNAALTNYGGKMPKGIKDQDVQRMIDEKQGTEQKIRVILGLAIGAASMCWEHVERAGVFDSTEATAIGRDAYDLIMEVLRPKVVGTEAPAGVHIPTVTDRIPGSQNERPNWNF